MPHPFPRNHFPRKQKGTRMPDKGQYSINGKTFTWTTEDGDQVAIPMRVKLGVIRALGSTTDLDAETMFTMLDKIAPGQDAVLDEMDVNEFVAMFAAWQAEYNAVSGASLGESSGSPA